jgi:hypothetical protein
MTDQEKLAYLVEAVKCMSNAIDNGVPDFALLEVRRVATMMDKWQDEDQLHEYISNDAYKSHGREAAP